MVLTTISLDFTTAPPTSQLLSILASNPVLRQVEISGCLGPSDGGGRSFRVQLHHLKKLELRGKFQHVFGLFERLDNPRNMDLLDLTLDDCDVADVSRIIGPYLRDHIQRREKSPGGLFLFLSSLDYLTLRIGDADRINSFIQAGVYDHSFVYISIFLNGQHHGDIREKAALDLITHPTERGCLPIHAPRLRRRMHTAPMPEDTIL